MIYIKLKLKALIIMVAINASAWAQNVDEEITKIRNNFKEIETSILEGKYKISTHDFEKPESNSYGTITYYSDDKGIRKIIYDEIINEENNQKTSYYIKNDKLFFAYHVSTAPRIIDAANTEYHYTENRYYYQDETAIRCLTKNYMTSSNSKEPTENISSKTPNETIKCTESSSVLSDFKDLLKKIPHD